MINDLILQKQKTNHIKSMDHEAKCVRPHSTLRKLTITSFKLCAHSCMAIYLGRPDIHGKTEKG